MVSIACSLPVRTPDGAAPKDMAFYLEMLGYPVFKSYGIVFADIHPTRSVSMAALMLAQKPFP